jgi:hypothetical protein
MKKKVGFHFLVLRLLGLTCILRSRSWYACVDFLRIGDFVTLKNVPMDVRSSGGQEGFLSADGILSDDIVVNDSILMMEDAVFCIHLKRQYIASQEYKEHVFEHATDDTNLSKGAERLLRPLQVRINIGVGC